ncbi:MAG: hypothetical protein O7E52_28755 [Candidatus Poribacteria bacterium]|nr:hypothetical protein [Candidatus Poribacteria bacterium]
MSSMIVAPQPTAVEEGAKVLMGGGNAVDAAVTCASSSKSRWTGPGACHHARSGNG